MKVLLTDDRRGNRDSLRRLVQREPEVEVSGIAEDEENAPGSVIARELRLTLDGCPVCDGGYRDHSFVILATVAIEPQWQSALHVKQYYHLLDERRWQELLCMREWHDAADTLIGFAFRCAGGRVGIVTMLSPARPGLRCICDPPRGGREQPAHPHPTRELASLAVNFSHPTVSYTSPGGALPLHTFVRFEPVAGKEDLLREELRLLLAPTRAEPGCIRIHLYEALRGPLAFYIHSEWVDEGAFDAHPKLPHMTRFLGLVRELTTHPVKGIRTKQIG